MNDDQCKLAKELSEKYDDLTVVDKLTSQGKHLGTMVTRAWVQLEPIPYLTSLGLPPELVKYDVYFDRLYRDYSLPVAKKASRDERQEKVIA